jgi:pimeloyl-ACP methyl ester carboxylesterase
MTRRTLHFVTAPDGTKIAWHAREPDAAGPGLPPLLLTNGIGTTENFWRHLVEELTRDRRVVHWDYRAHGKSELSVSGDYSLHTQAGDLARVTDSVMQSSGGTAPIHVAFSMGVAVLLELYRNRPELVRAMVLIGGSPDAPGVGTALFRMPGSMWAVQRALRAFTPVAPSLRPVLRALVKTRLLYGAGRALGVLQPLAPREEIEIFLAAIAGMDLGAYLRTLSGLMAAHGSDVLPRVNVPVLIIAAQKDTMMPLSQMKRLRDALPKATYVEIPDAGHAGMLEAGEKMAREIRAFLTATHVS